MGFVVMCLVLAMVGDGALLLNTVRYELEFGQKIFNLYFYLILLIINCNCC